MNLIEYLSIKNRKLKVIEIGAGVPLAELLFSFPGASKVVHETESPYGSAKERYNFSSRAVSKDSVEKILTFHQKESNNNFNTIVATSFQVPSNDNKIPHGWIGISYFENGSWNNSFHHVTLFDVKNNCSFTRKESVEEIKIILHDLLIEEFEKVSYLDISEKVLEQDSLKTLVTFIDGKPVRFEDHFRGIDNLILYKGSFNPIHEGHIEIAKKSLEKIPGKIVFGLSRNVYQKGKVSKEDLMKRILQINEAGFPVVVFDEGFFFDNFYALKNRFPGKVNLTMGVDTFNRLVKCYDNAEFSELEKFYSGDAEIDDSEYMFEENFGDTFFLVFGRNSEKVYTSILKINYEYVEFDMKISSTEIRKEIS